MKTIASLSALAMTVMPFPVQANVMTFGDLPAGQTYGLESYTEDGITAYGTDFWNLPNGTLHLDVGGVPTNNESYSFKLGVAVFDLDRFDVVALGVPSTAIGVVRGYGPMNVLKYSSELSIATSRTVSFTNWRGLSSVVILATGDIDDHFSIDNLTLSATLPEPATWSLMIIGFASAGVATRRQRTCRAAAGAAA